MDRVIFSVRNLYFSLIFKNISRFHLIILWFFFYYIINGSTIGRQIIIQLKDVNEFFFCYYNQDQERDQSKL